MIKKRNLALHICFRARKVSLGIKIMPVRCAFQLIVLLFFCARVHGQNHYSKPVLDIAAVNHWARVKTPSINNNGTYVGYMEVEGYKSDGILHLSSVAGSWTAQFVGVKRYTFTDDSQSVIILNNNDTLLIVKMGTKQTELVPYVKSFKLAIYQEKEWLFYTNSSQDLTLINLKSHEKYIYRNVQSWQQNKGNNTVIIIKKGPVNNTVTYLNNRNQEVLLGKFKVIDNLILDAEGKQVAFMGKSENPDSTGLEIYYCKLGVTLPKPLVIVKERSDSLVLENLEGFTTSGKQLLLKCKKTSRLKTSDEKNVKIWSYADPRLKSQEIQEPRPSSYLAVVNLQSNQLTQIEDENTFVNIFINADDAFIVDHGSGDVSEKYWNNKFMLRHYIYNTLSKSKRAIPFTPYETSPDKKYIIGRDILDREPLAYEVSTGRSFSITANIPTDSILNDSLNYEKDQLYLFAGWASENKILLYDDNDIWQIDLQNSAEVLNLTNGYGKKHSLTLRFANRITSSTYTDLWLLNAFDNVGKQNGYYKLQKTKVNDPVKLTMNDVLYNVPYSPTLPDFYPVKAKNANVWIVRSQRSDQSPNYLTTTDFIKFKQISNVYPERGYNWLRTELLNFKMADGKTNQALLYKPENFDSSKKYPVIITYYEKLADRLNTYLFPELSQSSINIPWFVSRGYIVCTPDIIYKIGEPGESALNSVNGTIDILKTLPYIDSSRVAIYGHSFGGYETEYIITHSKYPFAAATAACATNNLISDYGDLWSTGISKQQYYEQSQFRMGATLWDRPDLYIKNSPIFKTNKVSTPLLMMNNRQDGAVNFIQGVAFFTALRRLEKKVWMLEYDGETHSLFKESNQLDYTNRLEQFFGHYLKGQSMPDWMNLTNGLK
jgi:dipeptidyl aminopeptidase/acylaminoacyl peptidase